MMINQDIEIAADLAEGLFDLLASEEYNAPLSEEEFAELDRLDAEERRVYEAENTAELGGERIVILERVPVTGECPCGETLTDGKDLCEICSQIYQEVNG